MLIADRENSKFPGLLAAESLKRDPETLSRPQ